MNSVRKGHAALSKNEDVSLELEFTKTPSKPKLKTVRSLPHSAKKQAFSVPVVIDHAPLRPKRSFERKFRPRTKARGGFAVLLHRLVFLGLAYGVLWGVWNIEPKSTQKSHSREISSIPH